MQQFVVSFLFMYASGTKRQIAGFQTYNYTNLDRPEFLHYP